MERLQKSAERIYIVNDIGGNVGTNFANTVDLLIKRRDPLVLCGVLHHDDCLAAREGVRKPLDMSAKEMTAYLASRGINCPVLTGTVRIEHGDLVWSDEPKPEYFTFHMPRMYG